MKDVIEISRGKGGTVVLSVNDNFVAEFAHTPLGLGALAGGIKHLQDRRGPAAIVYADGLHENVQLFVKGA